MEVKRADKEKCIEAVRARLSAEQTISFAYLHGSFVSKPRFNDIDIAVYVNEMPASPTRFELDLENSLAGYCANLQNISFDVRVLNTSPMAFRYQASKDAILLFSHDEQARVSFEANTRSLYFDFVPLRNSYLAGALGRAV